MSKSKIKLEEYVGVNEVVDAEVLRKKLDASTDELNHALLDAENRGVKLACYNGMIFRANSNEEFQRGLLKVWEISKSKDITERSVTQSLNRID